MSRNCSHLATIQQVTASARGCEECIKTGAEWFHLRVCRTCGHVGRCDQSSGRHATRHYPSRTHPIIGGYDPPKGWDGHFVEGPMINLPDQTPQLGPIPRSY